MLPFYSKADRYNIFSQNDIFFLLLFLSQFAFVSYEWILCVISSLFLFQESKSRQECVSVYLSLCVTPDSELAAIQSMVEKETLCVCGVFI